MVSMYDMYVVHDKKRGNTIIIYMNSYVNGLCVSVCERIFMYDMYVVHDNKENTIILSEEVQQFIVFEQHGSY